MYFGGKILWGCFKEVGHVMCSIFVNLSHIHLSLVSEMEAIYVMSNVVEYVFDPWIWMVVEMHGCLCPSSFLDVQG